MSEIDFKALQKTASETVIPDGDYVCMFIKTEAVTASTGKPMIKYQLAVVDGPKKDWKLFGQQVIAADSPFALQRFFANMAACGLDQSYFDRNPSMDAIAADLLNRGVVAIVGHREWQGANRNEIQGFRPFAPNGPLPPGMIVGPPRAGGPSISAPPTSAPSGPPSSPASTASTGTPATQPPSRPF